MAILETNQEKGYIIVDNFKECIICGEETNKIDFCFECRLCSDKCEYELIERIK